MVLPDCLGPIIPTAGKKDNNSKSSGSRIRFTIYLRVNHLNTRDLKVSESTICKTDISLNIESSKSECLSPIKVVNNEVFYCGYFTSSSTSNYLAYYDVTIVSADQSKHVTNIQKITAMLDKDITLLERTFPGKQKYIFVNDTNDSYINDTMAVVSIAQNSLYYDDTNLALISPK